MVPTQRNSKRPIEILYEDEHVVVFNKPAGMLVVSTPKKESNTLVNIVNRQWADQSDSHRLYPCHRLDRDTSGAILFAKGKRNQKVMIEAFKAKAIQKKYIAFVHGKLKKHRAEIKSYIRDLDQRKYQHKAKPKLAITRYNVTQVKKRFSVVEVSPETGRTNQIRIHFCEIQHPLLGERKYAYGRDYVLKFKRTALHASFLGWKQPRTHKRIAVHSPLSKDMELFLAKY